MAARRERSERRQRGDSNGQRTQKQDIGWGLATEDSGDEVFMRKVVFGVSVAIVGCLGIWILLTAAVGGSGAALTLTTEAPAPGEPARFAVKLCEFTAEERGWADEIMATEEMRTLAGGHECWIADLGGGRLALCFGRFEDGNSEQLREFLQGVRRFRSRSGSVPFESAVIWPTTE